ncbi:hypothetical protein EPI10_006409 [Gossypium australe]|uniref:Chaperone surA n=1 Tax=Gossypium australe TaxID=47621 RepID=A0A5B6WR59_9ROSI|nr:hypothetical protein EPI10_006409 [Gossypium australe]
MSAELNQAMVNKAKSNVQASNLEESNSASMPQSFGDEIKNVFLGMINQWFNEFKQANLATPLPLPPTVPPSTPLDPQNLVPVIVTRVVSLLKDEAYLWWDSLSTMTSNDRIN